jgi:hypothetical protein
MATTQPLCVTVFTDHPQLQDSLTLLDRLILASAKISRTPFSYCSLRLCFHNNHLDWSLAQRKITVTNQDAQKQNFLLSTPLPQHLTFFSSATVTSTLNAAPCLIIIRRRQLASMPI